jgi:hypothetical protein
MASPAFDDDLGLTQRVEDFTVKGYVSAEWTRAAGANGASGRSLL